MPPDHTIEDIKKSMALWFGVEDEGLGESAAKLLDAGFGEPEIREILVGAFNAGHDEGYSKGLSDAESGF